jgi:hypothetical protein
MRATVAVSARARSPSIVSWKRETALIAAAPRPGTSSGRPATSQIGSPVVLACEARRPWLVLPMPRRGELTTRAKERVLEDPAHRVGAIEDRDLLAGEALLGDQSLDLAGHPARLLVLVGQLGELHRVPTLYLGPQPLRPVVPVAFDQRVGRREDGLGGAVVLLQLHDLGVGEIALEVEDVADVGVTKAVDRLEVVADDHQVAVLLGEQLQKAVLGAVGVLVLVDQDVVKRPPPALADGLEELDHVDAADQEVVEVHRVGLEHSLLVEPVDVSGRLLEHRPLGLGVGDGVDEAVLGPRYLGPDRARWEALRVDL